MKTIRLGWLPDLPDHRDLLFSSLPKPEIAALPPLVDLRPGCPAVYDQGQLGSCTANAIAGAFEFGAIKEKEAAIVPSRLFIYYNERVIEGTVKTDSGAQIRDGIKSVATTGICPETKWPYNIAKFAKKPSKTCYTSAKKDIAIQYLRIDNTVLNDLKSCLAAGFPFVFGITVYSSFMTESVANSGMVPMPGKKEQVEGGHALMAVGYDDNKSAFIVRNSWGDSWGLKGYCYIPYQYLTSASLADDFWTIRQVS